MQCSECVIDLKRIGSQKSYKNNIVEQRFLWNYDFEKKIRYAEDSDR